MLASPLTLLLPLLPLLALSAQAHSIHPPHLRHRRIAANSLRDITHERDQPAPRAHAAPRANTGHADAKRALKKSVKKRAQQQCRQRGSTYSASATSSAAPSTDASPTASSTETPTASLSNGQAWAPYVAPTTSSEDDWWSTSTSSAASTTSSAAADWAAAEVAATFSSAAAASPTSASSSGSSSSGLLTITDATCGYSNADSNNPNGAETWLNCGLTGSGWTPPMVTVDQLIAADLTTDGVFAPCAAYIDKFNSYASQYGLKGIMLASFAMQESTCDPSVTGGNGEAGLMQLTKENCGGAPGGDCYDVDFNIKRATELFSSMLSANGGNVLLSIGSYNGCGLTEYQATLAASQGRCAAQNNLDYIHQFCNGWMQNKSGYEMGTFFNLASC